MAPRKTRKTTTPEKAIEAASGNVFAHLRVPNADQTLAKAELVRRICSLITAQKLPATEAATTLGIAESRLSALIRGQLNGFSTDRLFRFLNALGQDVEIIVRPRKSEGSASTRVSGA